MCSRIPLCIPDTMKLQEDSNATGSEDELNNAMRMLARLMASKIEPGYEDPHLAPVKKQLHHFHRDIAQINQFLKLARSGSHAVQDAKLRALTEREVLSFEQLTLETSDGRRQLQELSCLAYLTEKRVMELTKQAPNERQILQRVMGSAKALSQMENRLDIAQKQFNIMNAKNRLLRSEINRLLVERGYFNTVWYRLIQQLVKGKLFLLDVLSTAVRAFDDRQDVISRLNALKWKANLELDRDLTDMQDLQHRLDHLQKLEEFLRVKGTLRVCEAVEIERRKQEETTRLKQQQIEDLEALLHAIRADCSNKTLYEIVSDFKNLEVTIQRVFVLICYIFTEFNAWDRNLGPLREEINERRFLNVAQKNKRSENIRSLELDLSDHHQREKDLSALNSTMSLTVMKGLRAIEEMAKMIKIDYQHIVSTLGNTKAVHRFNIILYLLQIQRTATQLLQFTIYMKTIAKTEKKTEKKGTRKMESKTTQFDSKPYLEPEPVLTSAILRPNAIKSLVTYQPCAYCVEEYIMNQVRDYQWEVFTDEAVMDVLLSEESNTPFGLYTVTDPSKRHPLAGAVAI